MLIGRPREERLDMKQDRYAVRDNEWLTSHTPRVIYYKRILEDANRRFIDKINSLEIVEAYGDYAYLNTINRNNISIK